MNNLLQTKVDELRIWHDRLEDICLRKGAPGQYVGALHAHAETLERLGIISTMECFQLKETADAAYLSVIEGDIESYET